MPEDSIDDSRKTKSISSKTSQLWSTLKSSKKKQSGNVIALQELGPVDLFSNVSLEDAEAKTTRSVHSQLEIMYL